MGFLTIILIAFVLLFTSQSTAEIQSLNIRSDCRDLTFIEQFEFTNTGYISVAVYNVSVSSPYNFNPSCIVFFLVKSKLKNLAFRLLDRNSGVINSNLISPIFTFENLSTPYSPFNITLLAPYPDMLSLYFANCNPETYVTMDVRTEVYNTINNGTTKVYLSLPQLPLLYFTFSLVYLCFLGFWILVCFKNKEFVHKVELLMGGLLAINVDLLICEAFGKHYVNVTGTPHGWDTMVYMCQFFRFVLLFTMVVFNCTGFRLSSSDVIAVAVCFLLYSYFFFLSFLPSVIIGDDDPFDDQLVGFFLEMIRSFAILFPIFLSIVKADEDMPAAKSLKKFWGFLIVASGYLFYWRIPIWVVKIFLGYEYYRWVSIVGDEICNLMFYMVMMVYMFRNVRKTMNTSSLLKKET